ncbi:MAG: hypothetical protein QHJ34_11545 [bacterium]|jgi:DNA polymerase-4|nr:hypothetical protein [candidate division KSB1 bacterium]MDH7560847.1 hypothetical protein [bacterium]
MQPRAIIYADATAFPVQVERLRHPRLRGYPVVIAPPGARAQVLALSFEARQAGLRKGMRLKDALKQCRDVVVLPPDERIYARATQAMNKVLSSLSPVFEPERYGHTYLDITSTQRLFGGATDTAWRAQKELKSRLQLEVAVGLASNKMVSKFAAAVIKPSGLRRVPQGEEGKFIAPFLVGLLPAVTKPIQEHLLDLNIRLVRHLQQLSLPQLAVAFGQDAVALYQNARGVDPRPVQPPDQAPRVCVSRTLPEESNDLEVLRAALFVLLEKAARSLRTSRLFAHAARIHIFYADYREAAGQCRLPVPSNMEIELYPAVAALLETILARRTRVRALSLVLFDLKSQPRQLPLFAESSTTKSAALTQAIDRIRTRFGEEAIRFARSMVCP